MCKMTIQQNQSRNTEIKEESESYKLRFRTGLTLVLMVTSLFTLTAFSCGGGKSHKSSIYRGLGVDSIGAHIGGDDVDDDCPEHSEKIDGLCKCVEGYTPKLDGTCVENQCLDFEPTFCAQACEPTTGELEPNPDHDGEPCNNNTGRCANGVCAPISCDPCYVPSGETCVPKECGENRHCDPDQQEICVCNENYEEDGDECLEICKEHEVRDEDNHCVCEPNYEKWQGSCVPVCEDGQIRDSSGVCRDDPCEAAGYDIYCQTCTVVDGAASISNINEDGACGANKNHICISGVCTNPCEGKEDTECIEHVAQNGVCVIQVHADNACGTSPNLRCGDAGDCSACAEGYEYWHGQCLEPCPEEGQSRNDSGVCTNCPSKASLITTEELCLSCSDKYYWTGTACLAACPEGKYHNLSGKSCNSCTSDVCSEATPHECLSLCGESRKVIYREYESGIRYFCSIKVCSEGKFHVTDGKDDGECRECTIDKGVKSTPEECALCTTNLRYHDGIYCRPCPTNISEADVHSCARCFGGTFNNGVCSQ